MTRARKSPVLKIRSASAAETRKLGRRLASAVRPGDVILLLADLGAGKTTFVQGVAKALGVRDLAPSPTFIIAQSLEGRRRVLHHIDFYRLDKQALLDYGIQDYLTGGGAIARGVVMIEWADRCRELWPDERLEISISSGGDANQRIFRFSGRGDRALALVKAMKS